MTPKEALTVAWIEMSDECQHVDESECGQDAAEALRVLRAVVDAATAYVHSSAALRAECWKALVEAAGGRDE